MSRKKNTTSSVSPFCQIESLEGRQFLSAAPQIDFANFAKTDNLVTNGFGDRPVTVGNKLRLTEDDYWQARSVFFDTRVPIEKWRTDFSFRSGTYADGADGLTFTVMNGPTSELGANGRGLGYGNIKSPSAAFAFNQFNFYKYGSKFGFANGGERPGTNVRMHDIDLHNGHVFKVTATYDGKTMNVVIVDAKDPTLRFSASQNIDLKAHLGSGNAIVGFTGATGANRAEQDILSWKFTGEAATAEGLVVAAPSRPTITIAANSATQPVGDTKTTLSVLADDATGESNLKYTWRAVDQPQGVKAPTYSANRTNGAKDTTVFFSAAGSYRLRVTVTNQAGLKATSDVDVDVTQVATSIRMTPHKTKLKFNQTAKFRATMLDQFNTPMRVQPRFTYDIASGTGTIDARRGTYVAPSLEGHVDIIASASGITGTVGVTIYAPEQRHTGTASA